MMKFLLVLVIGCAAVACGFPTEGAENATGAVASIREYPSFLHKCTASFLTRKALLGVATCLLCLGNCKFYAAVVENHLEDSNVAVYEVEAIHFHPEFMHNTENNLAVIFLYENVTNPVIYALPRYGMDVTGLNSHVFSWLFAQDMKNYSLVSSPAISITNEICSYYFAEFVFERFVCVKGRQPLALGPADHGSPVVCDYEGYEMVVGIFTSPGIVDGTHIVKYLSIFPYLDWIKSIINGVRSD